MDIPVPQIPPMMNLQFAQAPNRGAQLAGLLKNIGSAKDSLVTAMTPSPALDSGAAVPGAQGATAAGGINGPQPLVAPGTTPQGPPNLAAAAPQQLSILDAIRGMSPPQILDVLRGMSQGGQQVTPPGVPGAMALQGAGMMPSTYGG